MGGFRRSCCLAGALAPEPSTASAASAVTPLPLLFDTDAISEILRPRPAAQYLAWLLIIPRAEQFTSTVVIGELFKRAYRSPQRAKHLKNIEERILPAVTALPYDVAVARRFGEIHAQLSEKGRMLMDADLQIAATALHHDLELVTGNIRHFERVPGLRLNRTLAEARA